MVPEDDLDNSRAIVEAGMIEEPILLNAGASDAVVSIMRSIPQCDTVVVLVPPFRGRRTGPGRFYVELARDLATMHVASVCIDIPQPASNDHLESFSRHLATIEHALAARHFESVIWAGFSASAVPVLNHAARHQRNVILFSPSRENYVIDNSAKDVNCLCIIGEDDQLAGKSIPYWRNVNAAGVSVVDVMVLKNTGHGFPSWESKHQVRQIVKKWLTRHRRH
jgi:hypothetical protein